MLLWRGPQFPWRRQGKAICKTGTGFYLLIFYSKVYFCTSASNSPEKVVIILYDSLNCHYLVCIDSFELLVTAGTWKKLIENSI